MKLCHVLMLVSLALCHLEVTDALGQWVTNLLADNADAVGIPFPGLLRLMSKKSNSLTKLLHLIFGNYFERKFQRIIERAVELMPDAARIEDVNSDNPEKMTLHNGYIHGLRSIQVTPNTDVKIIWSSKGIPAAIVSVQFTGLRVNANIKTSFAFKEVNGNADIKYYKNNFVLYFHLHPKLLEWCYLKLYNVFCSDMQEMTWKVYRSDGTEDMMAASFMQSYFTGTDGEVENHINTTIANVIYHEVPKASPAICDNMRSEIRLSEYQEFRRANTESAQITSLLEADALEEANMAGETDKPKATEFTQKSPPVGPPKKSGAR